MKEFIANKESLILGRCIGGGTDTDIKSTKGGVGIAGGAVIKEKSASGAVPRFELA